MRKLLLFFLRKYKRIEKRVQQWSGDWDIILDPVIPTEPSLYALESGNWANDWLDVSRLYNDIKKRLQRPVSVYVFDTGVNYEHSLLKDLPGVNEGVNFVEGSDDKDTHGHSTHVAGCIAALSKDTPLGVARGLVEAGLLEIIPYKVLDDRGRGSYQTTAKAVRRANVHARDKIAAGRFVIYNFSLGGGGSYGPLNDALKEAEEMGVIACAANGNTGKEGVQHPGNSPSTLGTAALRQTATGVTRSSYSTYGPETWGAAPGSSILSCWPPDDLRLASGTSMASPTLAGTFAVLASIFPDATATELKDYYISKAEDLGDAGRDDFYGYGSAIFSKLLEDAPDDKPDDPDPDPGDPEERPVAHSPTYVLNVGYNLRWQHHNYDASSAVQSGQYTVLEEEVTAAGDLRQESLNALKITRVDITVLDTKRNNLEQERELSREVNRYLSRTAMSVPDFMSYSDVAFWIAWFLDRQLTNVFGEVFRVELIEAQPVGEGGRDAVKYAYRADNLKPYSE